MEKLNGNKNTALLNNLDFCKSFHVDGHQVVFILLDDEDHVPVLTLICEIDGERVKSVLAPHYEGKPITDHKDRFDFALHNFAKVTEQSAIEFHKMLSEQWRKADADKALNIDTTKELG